MPAPPIDLMPPTKRDSSRSRFSEPTRALFEELGRAFVVLTERQHHVRSTHAELVRVARGKPFAVHHPTMWRMMLAERDMVIVRAASWIKGFYSPGGFLRKVQAGDLRALALRWERAKPGEWRRKAFERLFPMAAGRGVPNGGDVDALVTSLRAEFRPLVDDRHEHRAHPFEHEGTGTAKRLDLTEVAAHLNRIHTLLADLHCLSAANHFTAWDTSPDADSAARDLVDLILCGPLGWIVDQVDGRSRREPCAKAYAQRREVHYARMHAAHATHGAPAEEPFNATRFLED